MTSLPSDLDTIMSGSAPVIRHWLQNLAAINAKNTGFLGIYRMTEVDGVAVVIQKVKGGELM
ncbi:hypothetical protein [Veronia pacifica]|uniref:hypothetical protein n=1 Tax=Veronia pacifica TaxID=1080227 RepID=UPI001112CDC3|nr:hypothetical protein [Veronia pacifica]